MLWEAGNLQQQCRSALVEEELSGEGVEVETSSCFLGGLG